MTDSPMQLISSVKVGDVVAFERLAELYEPLLKAEIGRFMNGGWVLSASDRDDLNQEALLSLYKACCSFKEQEGLSFGLYAKICIHNSLSHAASKLSNAYRALDMEGGEGEEEADSAPTPEERLIATERLEAVQSFMESRLTEYERKVFALHLSHRTYAEIAETVGKDVKSVANAIVRVKSKLRDCGI